MKNCYTFDSSDDGIRPGHSIDTQTKTLHMALSDYAQLSENHCQLESYRESLLQNSWYAQDLCFEHWREN